MGIGRRIRESRERLGLTQEELGKKVGVTGSAITNYEKEVSHPKETVMYALLRELKVDPNYLFQDCVDISNFKNMEFSAKEQDHIKKYRTLDEYGKESVDVVLDVEYKRCRNATQSAPVITLPILGETKEEPARVLWLPEPIQPAAAGMGQAADDEETEDVPVVYNEITRKADYIMRVSGDSMEPKIHDGDRVLVRMQPAVEIGEIGVFIRDSERYVKIYRGDHLESINPQYEPMEFRGFSECKGLVVGVLKHEWIMDK